MRYDDFNLRLTEIRGARAIRAESLEGEDDVVVEREVPAGSATNALSRQVTERADELQRGTAPDGEGARSGEDDERELVSLGQELFSFLFPGPVALLWHRSRARAAESHRGLRLRIHLDLRREDAAWFSKLPWELLYDDDSGGFLALDGRTPVVRYLDMRSPRRSFPSVRPLRVLVIMPEPYGVSGLDLEAERDSLLETWREDERVDLVFPDMATFEGVRQAMRSGPIHAIHFMGHGTFDEKAGVGGLILEGPSGRASPLVGRSVGKLVAGVEPQPVFAVLNGCDTGRTGDGGGPWPFGYAATALMKAGLPASVAMQLPIRDDVATHFSRVLYHALQDGFSVEQAVAEARLSLSEEFLGPAWAIPALFMRVADGRLFGPDQAPRHDQAPRDDRRDAGSDRVKVTAREHEVRDASSEIIGRDEVGETSEARGPRETTVEATGMDVKGGELRVVGVRRRK